MEKLIKTEYQLIDSGNKYRIERFGEVVLKRPSSLAIWNTNKATTPSISAIYEPKEGWKFAKKELTQWSIAINSKIRLNLRLQNNGQIGFFPEHLSYQNLLTDFINNSTKSRNLKVLNLYAYTGLNSLHCSLLEAEVTHVDILQTANNWARENYEANKNNLTPIKFITEDAIKYCQRAINRKEKYDLIITDPPSFSRIGKNSSWNLEDNLIDQVKLYKELISGDGMIIFTSHLHEFGNLVVENIFKDVFGYGISLQNKQLFIEETTRNFKLPSGFLVYLKL